MAQQDELITRWRQIQQAGGINGWIQSQLEEQGFAVRRQSTEGMSQRELDQYKKQLREESAARKRLKKEAWQAYRATHLVFLGENVYWNDDVSEPDRWDIRKAEERAAENELPRIDKPQQLAELLDLSISELRWFTYHREAATRIHYVRFTIPKRDGTERPIWAPLPKLKEAQRWILTNIVERLPVHGSAHGFLPGRSTLSNAQAHEGASILLQMDVQNFFPTVTLPRVKGIFRHAGYREPIAQLLALLCTESPREIVELNGQTYFVALGPRCLPQGAPTSPGLTNTLCLRMDRRIQGLASKLGWRFTRYADDLTFSLPGKVSSDAKIGTLMGGVKHIVEEEGFRIHEKKTRVRRLGSQQKITGFVVNDNQPPRVPRSLRRRLRAALHNLKQGKPLHPDESPETLRGYAAYLNMSDPERGKTLLAELEKLLV